MLDIEKRATVLPPSRVVGLRVRETRKERRWTQEQLAQELREVGIRIGQTDVARLEKLPGDKGHDPRSVTLEDWLALAFVLDVPPLALLLPTDEERLEVLPKGARRRDPERSERKLGPVEPEPRTYSGDWHPVHESRERTAAWIVGTQPLNEQRGPGRYRSYGRQDTQTSGASGLGAYLRMLAGLLDSEDLDGQRAVIYEAQQYLAGADRALEMKRGQDS